MRRRLRPCFKGMGFAQPPYKRAEAMMSRVLNTLEVLEHVIKYAGEQGADRGVPVRGWKHDRGISEPAKSRTSADPPQAAAHTKPVSKSELEKERVAAAAEAAESRLGEGLFIKSGETGAPFILLPQAQSKILESTVARDQKRSRRRKEMGLDEDSSGPSSSEDEKRGLRGSHGADAFRAFKELIRKHPVRMQRSILRRMGEILGRKPSESRFRAYLQEH